MNRILFIDSIEDSRRELKKIGVSSRGIEVMAPKAIGLSIKLTNVRIGAANILKQEMLSVGGDAAVARGVVNGKTEISAVILLGNVDKIQKLIKKLENQEIFGLQEIRTDLVNLLHFKKEGNRTIASNGRELILDSTKIIGVLNITPDSFSDGNLYLEPAQAVQHAIQMIEDGADIIDIGGESSRPGAAQITVEEEKERVIPVIKEVRKKTNIPISIDTYKSEVARAAIKAGADIINDISALRFDNKMIEVLQKEKHVTIILMHMQGKPENMQKKPYYKDTIEEILAFLKERIEFCILNGISLQRIMIDPGIGFGKRFEDNTIILKKLSEFHSLNVPVVLGASRKSFIGKIYPSNPRERLEGSLATSVLAYQNKIQFVRVHDVKEHKKLLKTLEKIRNAE